MEPVKIETGKFYTDGEGNFFMVDKLVARITDSGVTVDIITRDDDGKTTWRVGADDAAIKTWKESNDDDKQRESADNRFYNQVAKMVNSK